MDNIKGVFRELIKNGTVKAELGGPKENVLVCETLEDYCIASTEIIQRGYSVLSPGGFSGANDVSRKALDARVWRYGTVCATSYNKKTLLYHDKYLYIISELPESPD